MTRQAPIVAPIALSCTKSVTTTLPWFVQKADYWPLDCTFKPLVNGEEAFGEVYDAIAGARASVDILCWGFQPSMYFKRGKELGLPIGELLEKKGRAGVRVRLLCWQDDLGLAEFAENNMHGNNLATLLKLRLPPRGIGPVQPDYQTEHQREFDVNWFLRANLRNVTRRMSSKRERLRRAVRRTIGLTTDREFPNVDFATRGFGIMDRAQIGIRLWLRSKVDRSGSGITAAQTGAMAAFPTHHQKMVLVDYESPDHAVGFVMGHNMIDAYWDRDDHAYKRLPPHLGRNGLNPRQDVSSRVTGPILRHLNANFCESWDASTDQQLGKAREKFEAALCLNRRGDQAVMAQLLRTKTPKQHWQQFKVRPPTDWELDKPEYEIHSMYMQAVNNVTKFIYIENQYFRLPELAEKLKAAVAAQFAAGRDLAEHGPIYLFVVTNSNDDGIGPGTYRTYEMLNALGKAHQMPGIVRAEREDELTRLRKERVEAENDLKDKKRDLVRARKRIFRSPERLRRDIAEAEQALAAAHQRLIDNQMQIEEASKEQPPPDIPGLKVHICTLVAPDSPPHHWDYVYIHSKLMIVDDVFMTIGSANINTRSMVGDSELNICHENAAVTHPLRKRIWGVHTKGMGAQEDVGRAFVSWSDTIKENFDRIQQKKQQPYASLVEFHRESPKRSRLD